MASFGSCECGEYDCSYCGPIVEQIRLRDQARAREVEKKKKASEKFAAKMLKACSELEMPYGKYKGQKLISLSPAYCYTLLSYPEQRLRLNSVLIPPLEFLASKYNKIENLETDYDDIYCDFEYDF